MQWVPGLEMVGGQPQMPLRMVRCAGRCLPPIRRTLFEKMLNSCTVAQGDAVYSSEHILCRCRPSRQRRAGFDCDILGPRACGRAGVTHSLEPESGGKQLPLSAGPGDRSCPAEPGLLLKARGALKETLSRPQRGVFWGPIDPASPGDPAPAGPAHKCILSQGGGCSSALADACGGPGFGDIPSSHKQLDTEM